MRKLTLTSQIIKAKLLVLMVLVCGLFAVNAQDTLDFEKKYLTLDDPEDFTGFELLERSPDSIRVFIAGENHLYFNSNAILEFKMLKSLHKQHGVNTLVMEFGFSRGYIVNKFVHTGDSVWYNMLEPFSHEDYLSLYGKIQEYNETLDSADRISVVGADVERFSHLATQLMIMQLPDLGVEGEDSVHFYCEGIRGFGSYDKATYKEQAERYYYYRRYNEENTLKAFIKHYSKNRPAYKEYLGDNYELFDKVVVSLVDYFKWETYDDDRTPYAYIFREQHMYNNFTQFLMDNPNAKVYAQYGRCHSKPVLQDEACSWYNYRSIAHRLKMDDRFVNKIATIGIFYVNDEGEEEEVYDMYPGLGVLEEWIKDDGELMMLAWLPDDEDWVDLKKHFDYVVINNVSRGDEIEEDDFLEDIFNYEEYLTFYVDYGFQNFNLDELNNTLALNNYSTFQSPLNSWKFGYNIYTDRVVVDVHFMVMNGGDNKNLVDTSMISLSGWQIGQGLGYDLIPSKYFDFVASYGLSYGMLSLRETYSPEKIAAPSNPFGDNQLSSYTNPFFVADIGFELGIRLKFVYLSAKTGGYLDLSKKNWRANGELIENSPKTSASRLFYSAGIGLRFEL